MPALGVFGQGPATAPFRLPSARLLLTAGALVDVGDRAGAFVQLRLGEVAAL